MKILKTLFLLLFSLILTSSTFAQQIPFQEEVKRLTTQIDQKGWSKGSIVFTGSSSIRMWKNIQEEFPEVPIINTGFGGSQASDLLTHLETLVIRYDPQAVFIYEGDNDINAGKSTEEIIKDLDQTLHKLNDHKEGILIYFIGAKPSPSRWNLKESYEQFNKTLESYAEGMINSHYLDVWTPMLDPNGNPRPELFLEDMLHMKPEGYEIWKKQLDSQINFLNEMIYK